MKKQYCIFILGLTLLIFSQTNGIKEFLQEPLRTYKNSQYGRIEHGAIVITNDGKYRIEKNVENELCFNMYYDINLEHEILKGVRNHKKKGNFYYVKADEGYAVVDIKSETCKIFVTVPKSEFVKYSGSVDEKGNKIFKSRFITDKNITYFNLYDDFTEEEKKVFNKMNNISE